MRIIWVYNRQECDRQQSLFYFYILFYATWKRANALDKLCLSRTIKIAVLLAAFLISVLEI